MAARPGIAGAILKFIEDSHQSRFLYRVLSRAKIFLWKNKRFFHFFVFFLKNDKDSHQKCYLFIDLDEKRNGFFHFFVFS